MFHRLTGLVGQKVLLRDIGDIVGMLVLGQKVIERLILARTIFFRDCLPPFLGVGKYRINVKNNATERVFPVPDDLAYGEFCLNVNHDSTTPAVVTKLSSIRCPHDEPRAKHFAEKQFVSIVVTVLQIVAPVFILGMIGFLWVRFGFEYRVEFVTRLAMTLSVPCLIFTALMKAELDPSAITQVTLAAIVAYPALALVAYLLLSLLGLAQRTFLAPVIFGNTGNLGLPLALFAFGEEGLGYAVVVFAVMAVYSFTFGVWVVSGGGSVRKLVQEPMVGATLLGGLFLYNGWQTPDWITNTMGLIGQMAIPLMLITLGVAVAHLRPAGMAKAAAISGAKVVICTATGWLVAGFFALDPVPFAVLVLQVSTPVAVTSYLMAEKYRADSDAVAALVVASTLLSVVTIPITLAVLL